MKPAWQSILGNQKDGVRDIPDVSLFASGGPWGHVYLFYDSDPADNGGGLLGGAGTSFAAPIMAGIQSLVNQHLGSRQGNPNPTYYALAAAEYGMAGSTSCNSSKGNAVGAACIFYDITEGDNDVPCTGSNNCYDPSGTYGVLSTSDASFQPAYPATVGWDFATGIGSVNAYNLVMAFSASATPTPTATRTATPTATATSTATATGSATPTATATTSATPTASATSTGSATPSGTATATNTAAPTPTATATATATNTATTTPTSTPTAVPELLKITPPSENFGKVKVGGFKEQSFTLSNPAKKGPPITFASPIAFSVPATNPQEFGFPAKSNNCPTQLFPKKTCKLTVLFVPAMTGPRPSSAVTVFDNATGAPQMIPLTGAGK
ncbi:MAG TPA: hypothetical protein VJX23_15755 [Candidatus Binataceae bacterium]|nr:hypothetical protein [Candidatus Binataceae bacterium]